MQLENPDLLIAYPSKSGFSPYNFQLKATGNFCVKKDWRSGQVKNLNPKQNFKSDMTPVDTFESDVMVLTPISGMSENSSAKPGFPAISSFENDGMGITHIDNLQFNNP